MWTIFHVAVDANKSLMKIHLRAYKGKRKHGNFQLSIGAERGRPPKGVYALPPPALDDLGTATTKKILVGTVKVDLGVETKHEETNRE